jgi:hypothetical protein
MPRRARISRPGQGALHLHVEPLEDRILLSGSAAATTSRDAGAAEYAQRGQPSSAPAMKGESARQGHAETYTAPSSRTDPAFETRLALNYSVPSVLPVTGTGPDEADLAIGLLGGERGAAVALPPAVSGLAAPAMALAATAPGARAANPAAAGLPGGGRAAPAAPAEQQAFPEAVNGEKATSATVAPGPQSGQEAAESRPAVLALPARLPGLGVGDWDEAARQFLRALESLSTGSGDPESVWVRLGYWGVAAAATVMMFELARQRLGKQRLEELDPLALRWGFPDPGPGHE